MKILFKNNNNKIKKQSIFNKIIMKIINNKKVKMRKNCKILKLISFRM